ncbi:hypothetical protein Salat_0944000 [Sesamum alatum]|uniref:Uncharacterized protein n=1 Tax=Sesamum alatum TaxID=300844 RepID=A0AAE1YK43_9LAMI|nr:hypothetical protein Salat_0944000 [Sesamum alatum]
MATGAAGDGLLRGVFEGCISAGDMGIQRRPYHKHCGCALHKSRRHCPHPPRHTTVSYPIRRSWSEGNLALIGQSSPPFSSSPAAPGGIARTSSQLALFKEEDELQGSSPKA